jgi:hypothetical protein
MPRNHFCRRSRSRAWTPALLLVALTTGGCAGGLGPGSPGAAPADGSHGFAGSGSVSDFFTGASAKAPQTVTGAQPDVNCPPVEVRQGASTLSIGPTEGNKSAMTLKYQGEFVREARDCAVVDGNMVMRIGVEGRVIVGPGGTPGPVDVPLRIAVVQETPGGARAITTKFIRIPVTIGANDRNAIFTHIEQGLTFPVPTPTSALDDYIAYIGFDPLTAQAQDKQKEKPAAKKPKMRPKPSANAN